MGHALKEPPSGRSDGGEPAFSEAYLVSARYGECRCVSGKVLSIFQIACGINEALVNRRPPAGVTFADLPLAQVLAMVPKGRSFPVSRRRKRSPLDREAHLTIQPILLLRQEGLSLVLDGLKRLAWLRDRGSEYVRCVYITEKRASFFGREGIDVLDGKGRPLARDIKQQTLKASVPPSIEDRHAYAGEDYDPDIRPALAGTRRARLPEVPDEAAELPPKAPEGAEEVKKSRAGQIIERNRSLIEDTHLTTLAPHLATVKHCRIEMMFEMTPAAARSLGLNLGLGFQRVLDRDIKIGRDIFKKGNAGHSVYEIVLIRFLLRLFDFIEALHKQMRAAALVKPRTSSANNGAINPRVGHTIVAQDPRYINTIGSFPDLSQKIKDWAEIATLTDGVYAHGVHERLFGIGLRLCRGAGADSLVEKEEHAYELLQATLKALRRAHLETGNSRDLRQHNNGKGTKSDLRSHLDMAADGEPSVSQSDRWDIDRTFRVLLALHARLNPAKIWRDETHLTLMYQWLIALGDLNRHGSMIVTCHMAQEFFLVQRFRSGGDNPALDAEWEMFDEALALAVSRHPAHAKVVHELVGLCAEGMKRARAQRVTFYNDGPVCLSPKPLSPETSKLAEAAIWLT
ncbi:hypothetical protein [uncultured Bosea sp.]|uniref:hypothetical protein n=1 Tax=uncultured Bosea sp. TaxID=211457 RepID=UPI0025E36D2D|nr:hypothetical protein [uncultured Bosea sp.]